MTTNVELYEALKPHVGQEAAGMIADVIPPARDLATRTDLAGVRTELSDVKAELKTDIAELRADMYAMEARLTSKFLTYSLPIWGIVGSMALAIVGLVATRL
jgi:hypothetical protein